MLILCMQPVATRLLCKRSPTHGIPAKMQHRIDKFCESMWKVHICDTLPGSLCPVQ